MEGRNQGCPATWVGQTWKEPCNVPTDAGLYDLPFLALAKFGLGTNSSFKGPLAFYTLWALAMRMPLMAIMDKKLEVLLLPCKNQALLRLILPWKIQLRMKLSFCQINYLTRSDLIWLKERKVTYLAHLHLKARIYTNSNLNPWTTLPIS